MLLLKLEVAHFYKRCTDRAKSVMGACSQTADFRTGCIARQRDMSMKRRVMRMAPLRKTGIVLFNHLAGIGFQRISYFR